MAAVADEEHASLGVQEVLETVRAEAAIVTEPTELELVVAHKGFVWLEIEVCGRAAHGSRPHLGVDAIVKTGPILSALGALDADLGSSPPRMTDACTAPRPSSGCERNPARCVVGLERRTLPGESAADVEAELAALLETCRHAGPELQAETRTLLVREPFEVPQDAEIVATVRPAAADVVGRAPVIGGASYWADAAFIAAAGIPTVMFGPAGEGAHASEEWVSIASTETVARILVSVADRVCA